MACDPEKKGTKKNRVGKKVRKTRTEFASRVGTDMRASLEDILNTTSLLLECVTDEKTLVDLGRMEQSGQHLLRLIEDTEDMSKIENDTLELKPVFCDAWTTFNNILDRIAPSIKEKNISFHVQADDLTFLKLYMDAERVEQILMNVLQNAMKFTPEGGCISYTMQTGKPENGVLMNTIIVEDNGIGMSRDFLPHLFEPFSREHDVDARRNQGTGLGMTISRHLIEAMGGDIQVESREGKGTKVTILLPLQAATQEQLEEWKRRQKANQKIKMMEGKHVLLCEDHPLNAELATRLLESRGIIVDNVENGRLAVDKFASSRIGYYDAIMMDIVMPVLDGLDATREIRSLEREDAPCVPIVAITANASSCRIQEAVDIGMTAHLSKPIEPDKLFEILEEVWRQKHNYIRGKVLIVDDIEVNRAVINAVLHYRFDILEAHNGQEATEILEHTEGIDAVITDIQMSEMDGYELIRRIRSQEKFQDMIILANTQYGTPEQEKQILDLGADDFVYKPTSPAILEMRLLRALNKKKNKEQKETEN